MDSFRWTKSFETGLHEVDKQHRSLVDLINRFGSQLAENNVKPEDVESLFGELKNYAGYHFQEEEKMMADVGLDGRYRVHHVNVHKGFLDDLLALYSSVSIEDPEQVNTLLNFLLHWLAYHILGEDKDMAFQVEAIQSGISPEEAYEKLERERSGSTEPLLNALNGLFDQVSRQNKQLKLLNESLEEKVRLRTRELFEANQQLEELSLTDALTGLPNRRHGMRSLARLWNESQAQGTPLACMMIDVDYFKQVNDCYGHDAGDEVLRQLAKALLYSLRSDDVVCRLGGDEFLILCPNTDKQGAMYAAELTHASVSELQVATGGEPWQGSISLGVACRRPEMKGIKELMKQADQGVYAAKQAGKNCIRTLA